MSAEIAIKLRRNSENSLKMIENQKVLIENTCTRAVMQKRLLYFGNYYLPKKVNVKLTMCLENHIQLKNHHTTFASRLLLE